MKEIICQPRIQYLVKLFIKCESKMKTFSHRRWEGLTSTNALQGFWILSFLSRTFVPGGSIEMQEKKVDHQKERNNNIIFKKSSVNLKKAENNKCGINNRWI